jgi:hypothetical protein
MLLRFVADDSGRPSLRTHPLAEWTDGEAAKGSPCQSGGVVKYPRGGPDVVVFNGSGIALGARELKDVEISSKEHEPRSASSFSTLLWAVGQRPTRSRLLT